MKYYEEIRKRQAIIMLCQMCQKQCPIFRTYGVIEEFDLCEKMKDRIGLAELLGTKDFLYQMLHWGVTPI